MANKGAIALGVGAGALGLLAGMVAYNSGVKVVIERVEVYDDQGFSGVAHKIGVHGHLAKGGYFPFQVGFEFKYPDGRVVNDTGTFGTFCTISQPISGVFDAQFNHHDIKGDYEVTVICAWTPVGPKIQSSKQVIIVPVTDNESHEYIPS
jgi:hypothetical protein